MNKIVRHHYPVSNLPDDLREAFAPDAAVTVVVEEESEQARKVMSAERLEELFALAPRTSKSIDEVNKHVREMRDEWDRDG